MKIELEFKDEQEIDELYYQIVYRRQNLDLERDKHIKMIKTGLNVEKDTIVIPFSSQTKQGREEVYELIDSFMNE